MIVKISKIWNILDHLLPENEIEVLVWSILIKVFGYAVSELLKDNWIFFLGLDQVVIGHR